MFDFMYTSHTFANCNQPNSHTWFNHVCYYGKLVQLPCLATFCSDITGSNNFIHELTAEGKDVDAVLSALCYVLNYRATIYRNICCGRLSPAVLHQDSETFYANNAIW